MEVDVVDIDVFVQTVYFHCGMTQSEFGVKHYIIYSPFEVVRKKANIGMLHVCIDLRSHLGFQSFGINRKIGSRLPFLLRRGGQDQIHIKLRCSHMDGVHVES